MATNYSEYSSKSPSEQASKRKELEVEVEIAKLDVDFAKNSAESAALNVEIAELQLQTVQSQASSKSPPASYTVDNVTITDPTKAINQATETRDAAVNQQEKSINDLGQATDNLTEKQDNLKSFDQSIADRPSTDTAIDISDRSPESKLEQENLTQEEIDAAASTSSSGITDGIVDEEWDRQGQEDQEALNAALAEPAAELAEETNNTSPDVQQVVVEGKRIVNKQTTKARPNPLDPFYSYTYGISLHVLKPSEYNEMIVNGAPYQATNVLIASGGRRVPRELESSFKRNAKFTDDFYIDELRIQTIIGHNSTNRGTNVVDVSFKIYEPYGMTLLERLIAVGLEIEPSAKSYIELPYVLQIDFFGNKGSGELVKIPQTKLIPIKIVEIKFRVTEKGAEYTCRAVPFAHQAFNETISACPINLEVTAGTVKMFFEDFASSTLSADTDVREERIAAATAALNENERSLGRLSDTARNSAVEALAKSKKIIEQAKNEPFIVSSYISAVNDYLNYLANKKYVTKGDKVLVAVDPVIGQSKIVFDELDAKRTPMLDPVKDKEVLTLAPDRITGTKQTRQVFPINAGSNIIDVINSVIRNSEYIMNQIKLEGFSKDLIKTTNPQELLNQSNSKKPLMWFKITPIVEIKDYDPKRNTFNKVITYNVTPYEIYNQKMIYAPIAAPPYWVKEYNYLYMGNNPEKPGMGPNKDVLRFDIEFNALFYTAYSVLRENFEKTGTTLPGSENKDIVVPPEKLNSTSNISRHHFIPHNIQTLSFDGGHRDVRLLVGDLTKSIYNTSKDLISVKLEILGDPEFIKQDDILYHAGLREKMINPESPTVDARNSLITDAHEIYVRLNFRTPSDINLNTGLVTNKVLSVSGQSYTVNSTFSGLYRVLKVDSDFSNGKFIQTLELVRMFNQEEDFIDNPNVSSGERSSFMQESLAAAGLPSLPELDVPIPDALPRTAIPESYDQLDQLMESASAAASSAQNAVSDANLGPMPDQAQKIAGDLIDAPEVTVDNYIAQSGGVFT